MYGAMPPAAPPGAPPSLPPGAPPLAPPATAVEFLDALRHHSLVAHGDKLTFESWAFASLVLSAGNIVLWLFVFSAIVEARCRRPFAPVRTEDRPAQVI